MTSPYVLVIDDDPAIRRLIKLTLEDEGFAVLAAEGCDRALALADGVALDAILLDLNMPGVDGRQCFRTLRDQGIRAPVLIVSAHGADRARRELGADGSLAKPFDVVELARRVRMLTR